jgi:hypothetical protein
MTADVLPQLARTVEQVVARLPDPQDRRWVAAAHAALSHQAQASAHAACASGRDKRDPPSGFGGRVDQLPPLGGSAREFARGRPDSKRLGWFQIRGAVRRHCA